MTERFSNPTLADVARHAGVSTATVSRTLNLPDHVSPQTRDRVNDAILALGYTPNYSARALASNRTNTVGAVIPTIDNAIFSRGIQAFQEELAHSGVTLLIASSGYEPEREEEQIRNLVARGVDGILLIGTHRRPAIYSFLQDRGIPYVLTWCIDDTGHPFVGFDNWLAAKTLTARILALGHRRVAMIAGHSDQNDRSANRIEGVRAALTEAGVDRNRLMVLERAYTLTDGGQALEEIVASDPDITAVICGNDVLAAGAVLAAHQLKLDVPGDISITGFDDIELATTISPALTTIHVPHRRMGCGAAQKLLALRDALTTEARGTILEVEIVERESLGPPRTAL